MEDARVGLPQEASSNEKIMAIFLVSTILCF
jgi:hypothetical protein